MKKITCKQAFEDGHKDRKKYPLPFGEYKLRESLDVLNKYLDELERIADYKRTRSAVDRKNKGYALRRCTPTDMKRWLRDLPPHIAHTLSYCVIPATSALKGDGVPEQKVGELLDEAVIRSENLVNRLGSGEENYPLFELISDSVGLIEYVLSEANLFIQTNAQVPHT